MYYGECSSSSTAPVYGIYGSGAVALISTKSGYHTITIKNSNAYGSNMIDLQVKQCKFEINIPKYLQKNNNFILTLPIKFEKFKEISLTYMLL